MFSLFGTTRAEVLETNHGLVRLKTARPFSQKAQPCQMTIGRIRWRAQVVPYRREDDGTIWVKICSSDNLVDELRTALREKNLESGSAAPSARRCERRYSAALSVRSPDLPGFLAETVDVSERGLRLLASQGVAEGCRLRLQVSYEKASEQPAAVIVTGVTVWSRAIVGKDKVQLGVRLGAGEE